MPRIFMNLRVFLLKFQRYTMVKNVMHIEINLLHTINIIKMD